MSTTVTAPIAWLAERDIVVGARVGCTNRAYHQLGTVVAVADLDDIAVRWDDGTVETMSWVSLAPNGYVVDFAEAVHAPAEQLVIVDGCVSWSRAA